MVLLQEHDTGSAFPKPSEEYFGMQLGSCVQITRAILLCFGYLITVSIVLALTASHKMYGLIWDKTLYIP